MATAVVMQADIWSGDWGLPSIDLSCLQTMTYAKFSGAPLKLRKTNNPWKSPNGSLPVILQGARPSFMKFEDFIQFLRKQNYSADFELSNKQLSDIKAYISDLEERLLPALLYIWWIDAKNYVELTRPWYACKLPFPQNYFYPGRNQRKAQAKIIARYSVNDPQDPRLETMLYKDAEECLTMLSTRLADQDFFLGKSPTSLDASVFAYLAPLLKAPFPNPTLQNHLKACNNLVRFVARILHNYFPLCSGEEAEKMSSGSFTKPKTDHELEFPHRRRNQLMCALFAIFAMLGYAFSSGLVQVEIVDENGLMGSVTDHADPDEDSDEQ